MARQPASRRQFLSRSLAGLGSAWLSTHWPEILAAHEHARRAAQTDPPAKFEFFTPEQAAEVEAVAAQIIPTDETPGAREARVIYFIDRALATFDSDKQELYIKGLRELQDQCRQRLPSSEKFSSMTAAQKIDILKTIEKSEFFEAVRVHTIAGFFANPEYGGNRDQIGWKLIGFEDQFSYEPPRSDTTIAKKTLAIPLKELTTVDIPFNCHPRVRGGPRLDSR
jgi:gluconate 2-dehydrogenase gamma chain